MIKGLKVLRFEPYINFYSFYITHQFFYTIMSKAENLRIKDF